MINIENVIETLKKHMLLLDKLANVCARKQNALINNNRDELEQVIQNESEIIAALLQLKKQHTKLLNEILEDESVKAKETASVKLSVLLKGICSEKEIAEIQLLEKRIREKIKEVDELNVKNHFLLQQARNFINEVINVLIGSKKILVDRKV